ncbi:MAG: SGNH/GDSL hydrolase family protein [Vicinamibacterales bacterium]
MSLKLFTRSSRLAAALIGWCVLAAIPAAAQAPGEHWVGTWSTATVGRPKPLPAPPPGGAGPAAGVVLNFANQTLRQVVRVSIGGDRLRVVVANTFGTAPLEVGAAQVALRDKESQLIAGSSRPLTFGGRSSVLVPAGALAFSDPVSLAVPALADLAIDLYLPGDSNTPSPVTMHAGGLQTNYVSTAGNHVGHTPFPVSATTQSWFHLARVEVLAPEAVTAVATIGASLTDGSRSTPDTNNRWPNHLARRLAAAAGSRKAVLNSGIGGSRLLSQSTFQAGVPGLARFDRDVVVPTGVTHVVVADMALNDIGGARENPSPSADDLIVALKQLIARAHSAGIKIIGATLTPFEGAGYYTLAGDAKRQAVNQWIRASGAFDAVVDFDVITRDPAHPLRFLPAYDSGDHLHPNDAGYQAMGNAIDLAIFGASGRSSAH